MGSTISSHSQETSEECSTFLYYESEDTEVPATVTHVVISEQVDYIKEDSFERCTNLIEVTLPLHLTKIGRYSFYDCTSLIEISIPNSVFKIEEGTFDSCSSLVKVTFPSSLKVIGSNAFIGCTSLKQVKPPESLREIDSYAFKDCSSLVYVHVPKSLQSIGRCAFKGCSRLSIIAIPDHVNVPSDCFDECSLINSVKGKLESTSPSITADYQFLQNQHRFANLPLHEACYDLDVTLDTLKTCFVTSDKNTFSNVDSFSMNALHILCANPNVTPPMISAMLNTCPSLQTMISSEEMTPLMVLIICKGILSHETIISNNVEGLSLRHCLVNGVDWDDIRSILELEDQVKSALHRKDDDTKLYPFMEVAMSKSYGLRPLYELVYSYPDMLFDN